MNGEQLGSVVHVRCKPGEPVRVISDIAVEKALGRATDAAMVLDDAVRSIPMDDLVNQPLRQKIQRLAADLRVLIRNADRGA